MKVGGICEALRAGPDTWSTLCVKSCCTIHLGRSKRGPAFFSQGILGDTGSGSFMLSVVRLEQRTGKAEGWKVPKVKERRSVLACPPTSQTFFLGRGDPSLSSSFFSGPLES